MPKFHWYRLIGYHKVTKQPFVVEKYAASYIEAYEMACSDHPNYVFYE